MAAGLVTPTSADSVCITNGPAISPDDSTLYHVDTLGKVILAHPILGDGTLGPATEFARFGDADGHPDARSAMPRAACGSASSAAGRRGVTARTG